MLTYNLWVLYRYVVVAAVILLLTSASSPHGMTVRSPSGRAATPTSIAGQCDFEVNLCGWSHDNNHDFEWNRHNYGTPSGHVGTGPSHDHTHGEGKPGYYMYIEASSPRKENDTARLYSPIYSAELSHIACFEFWYHMYGLTSGYLRIYIKRESVPFKQATLLFQLQGNQGNDWKKGQVQLTPLNENFQIVIEGVRGPSYVGDTAIDDVYLAPQNCSILTTTDSTPNSSATTTSMTPDYFSTVTSFFSTASELPTARLTSNDSTSAKIQSSTEANLFHEPIITTQNSSISSSSISSSDLNPHLQSSSESQPDITSKLELFTTVATTAAETLEIRTFPSLNSTTESISTKTLDLIATKKSKGIPALVTSPPPIKTSAVTQSFIFSISKPTLSVVLTSAKTIAATTTKPVGRVSLKYASYSTTLPTVFEADNQPLAPNARRGSKETSVTPIAVGATVGIVFMIVMATAGYFIISRRKLVQGKLDEDSELRYLANDVEYADPTCVPDPLMA